MTTKKKQIETTTSLTDPSNDNVGTRHAPEDGSPVQSLASIYSKKNQFEYFSQWIVGDTPLISHSWSEKARREMLMKQLKAPKAGKEARDPEADFLSSLYHMGDGTFGFPATGFKLAILSCAHKDKGVPRSTVMSALWINAEMVRTKPALAGAVCDMPLLRIHGSKPEMREDMVKIGAGLNKTANLSYRGQFTVWAFKATGRYNSDVLTREQLTFLIDEAGLACGIGEWRNERKGMFGAFHRASAVEEVAWEKYAAGKGPLPIPASIKIAAE
jgi:hypothetical protein